MVKADGSVVQKTHIARTHDEDNRCELIALPETETKLSLLGNLFLSNGKFENQLFLKLKKKAITKSTFYLFFCYSCARSVPPNSYFCHR